MRNEVKELKVLAKLTRAEALDSYSAIAKAQKDLIQECDTILAGYEDELKECIANGDFTISQANDLLEESKKELEQERAIYQKSLDERIAYLDREKAPELKAEIKGLKEILKLSDPEVVRAAYFAAKRDTLRDAASLNPSELVDFGKRNGETMTELIDGYINIGEKRLKENFTIMGKLKEVGSKIWDKAIVPLTETIKHIGKDMSIEDARENVSAAESITKYSKDIAKEAREISKRTQENINKIENTKSKTKSISETIKETFSNSRDMAKGKMIDIQKHMCISEVQRSEMKIANLNQKIDNLVNEKARKISALVAKKDAEMKLLGRPGFTREEINRLTVPSIDAKIKELEIKACKERVNIIENTRDYQNCIKEQQEILKDASLSYELKESLSEKQVEQLFAKYPNAVDLKEEYNLDYNTMYMAAKAGVSMSEITEFAESTKDLTPVEKPAALAMQMSDVNVDIAQPVKNFDQVIMDTWNQIRTSEQELTVVKEVKNKVIALNSKDIASVKFNAMSKEDINNLPKGPVVHENEPDKPLDVYKITITDEELRKTGTNMDVITPVKPDVVTKNNDNVFLSADKESAAQLISQFKKRGMIVEVEAPTDAQISDLKEELSNVIAKDMSAGKDISSMIKEDLDTDDFEL